MSDEYGLKNTPTAFLIRELEIRGYRASRDEVDQREQDARDALLAGIATLVSAPVLAQAPQLNPVGDMIADAIDTLTECNKARKAARQP